MCKQLDELNATILPEKNLLSLNVKSSFTSNVMNSVDQIYVFKTAKFRSFELEILTVRLNLAISGIDLAKTDNPLLRINTPLS